MKNKRIIKIVAVDKRYFDTPYPFTVIKDDTINTYLTGQHIDPQDRDTDNNLTPAEMKGEVALPREKADRFKFIINPNHEYPIINGMTLDITKVNGEYLNPRDGWLANMYMRYGYKIAKSRKAFMKGYDLFYIKDEISEAIEEVSFDDKVYEAMKLIKEKTNVSNYEDIALLLSSRVRGFFINVENKTEIVIKNSLIKVCKEKPEEVIACFSDTAQEDLKVLKMAKMNILQKKGNDFFDGDKFIGNSVKSVIQFMRDPNNTSLTDKWNSLLQSYSNTIRQVPVKEHTTTQNNLKSSTSISKEQKEKELNEMDLEDVKKEASSIKLYWGIYKDETDKNKIIQAILDKLY